VNVIGRIPAFVLRNLRTTEGHRIDSPLPIGYTEEMLPRNHQFVSKRNGLWGLPKALEEEIFNAYLNRADKIVIIHDGDFLVRMMNAYGCQTLGVKESEVKGAGWVDRFVVEHDRVEMKQQLKRLLDILSTGPLRNESTLLTPLGERIFSWQHFSVKRAAGWPLAILSVGEDLTDVRETEETLKRRNAILKAVSLAAEYFLMATSETWERNVIQVLEALGKARGSERVYLCKNRYGDKDKDKAALSLKYEWKANGDWHVFHGQEAPWLSYQEVGLVRWSKLLLKHEVISADVEDLSEAERIWNVAPETQSLVVVPVFVDDFWWGYLAFEDWKKGRTCSPEEMEAIIAVTIAFGAAIRRKRTEEALEREKESVEVRVDERTRELSEAQEKLTGAMLTVKEQKARLTASIHSINFGFAMTDLEGNVVLFNHAVSGILGPVTEYWTQERLAERLESVVDLNSTLSTCVREQREITLDEVAYGTKYLRIYFTPIKMIEDDGRVIGTVLLIEDITEAKKLQLSRDEFFAVAAHELRTPLSAIMGNASIIMDYFGKEMANPEIVEMVSDIDGSAKRLVAIVNEYLDASRLELNKMVLTTEKFDVLPEIRAAMDELKEQARQKHLEWNYTIEATELWVEADRQRTRQALINLLGNAIKYTETGGITVTAEASERRLKIRITDSGKGVSREEQDQLFQKFKQVGDRVYARDIKEGTGMGLYITRLLMEAMGGEVYLEESEKGKGSTFVMELGRG
jgi:PAS domain S-box-containing protein